MFNQDELLRTVLNVEPLPERIIRLIASADAQGGIEQLITLVSADHSFANQIIRWANAVTSAESVEIQDVREAVANIGSGMVLGIALAMETRQFLKTVPSTGNYLVGDLWRHSVASMFAARELQHICSTYVPDAALIAALLHDVGKAILAQFLRPEDLKMLWRAILEGGLVPVEAEAELLEINHAEVSALLAQSWMLPESIVRGVFHHHDPEGSREPLLSDVICAANHVVKVKSPESTKAGMLRSLERIGLDEKSYSAVRWKLSNTFEEKFDRFCAIVGAKSSESVTGSIAASHAESLGPRPGIPRKAI